MGLGVGLGLGLGVGVGVGVGVALALALGLTVSLTVRLTSANPENWAAPGFARLCFVWPCVANTTSLRFCEPESWSGIVADDRLWVWVWLWLWGGGQLPVRDQGP